MPIKPEQLPVALQKSLAPVYLIGGAEPVLVEECRDLVIKAGQQQGFLEREIFHTGAKYNWEEILDVTAERSLFSSRKIIDVRLPTGKPGQAGGKFLSGWAASPDPDFLFIVSCTEWETSTRKSAWVAKLSAAGVQVEIWPVKPNQLPAWIERRMKAAGLQPEREAVLLMAELMEGNLLAIKQEIEKLSLLVGTAPVTVDTVRQSASTHSRFDAFRLGECILAGNAAESLRVAAGMQRAGTAIQALLGALTFQLSQLEAVYSAIRSGENEARVFSRLRVFKSNQPAMRQTVNRLRPEQMAAAFHSLSLIDRQGKGRASGDPWMTLDQMLINLCAAPTAKRP